MDKQTQGKNTCLFPEDVHDKKEYTEGIVVMLIILIIMLSGS